MLYAGAPFVSEDKKRNREAVVGDDDHLFVDTWHQDQYTPIIDLYAFRNDGSFVLAVPVSVDDLTFSVEAGHSIAVDDIVCFQEGDRFMQATVTAVSVNNITIDTPFDYAFTTAGGCSHGVKNMAVNGSVTPQVFRISPGNLDGQSWDITRMLMIINDDLAMDDGKFGGIAALTNGIVFRVQNGITKNLFNIKTNGDLALRSFDATYVDATLGPAGAYGLRVRRSFNGNDKNGVTIRLNAETDDEFQVIIRDDLTGISKFNVIIQGHVVD